MARQYGNTTTNVDTSQIYRTPSISLPGVLAIIGLCIGILVCGGIASNVIIQSAMQDIIENTYSNPYSCAASYDYAAELKALVVGAVIGLGISLVPLCLEIVSIFGASISLYHAMLEINRRENFIGNSGFSLASGIIGLFFTVIQRFFNGSMILLVLGFIFAIIAFVFCLISMVNDLAYRRYSSYFIALSILLAVFLVGFSWYSMNQFQTGYNMVENIANEGSRTLNQLGTGSDLDTNNGSSDWSTQNYLGDNYSTDDDRYLNYEPTDLYPQGVWDLNHYNVTMPDGSVVQMSQDEYDQGLYEYGNH